MLRWLTLLGSALSLTLCVLLVTRSVTIGSAEGGWVYGYTDSPALAPLATAALAIAAASALLVPTWRVGRRHEWPLLVAWIAVATVLHGLIRTIAPYSLESLFVSDTANSFHSMSQEYEAADLLRRFLRIRSEAPIHAQSNMPGKVMLILALQTVTTHTSALPWLLIGVSNLGAVLMYIFVRRLFDDGRMALLAAALYLFTPARVWFFPLMNTITPVWLLGCLGLLVAWLRSGRVECAVPLGVALYALAFFEPLPLATGLLFVGLSVRAILIGQLTWERFAVQAAAMIAAFVATSEAVRAVTGFELLQAFRQIGRHAVEFNEIAARPYGVWLVANLREFTVAAGACALILAVGTVASPVPRAIGARRLSDPIVAVSIGLLVTLVTLDLLGVNRGEVVRLWIFLACLFQIPVACACARIGDRLVATVVLAVTILHATVGTAMVRFVIP